MGLTASGREPAHRLAPCWSVDLDVDASVVVSPYRDRLVNGVGPSYAGLEQAHGVVMYSSRVVAVEPVRDEVVRRAAGEVPIGCPGPGANLAGALSVPAGHDASIKTPV